MGSDRYIPQEKRSDRFWNLSGYKLLLVGLVLALVSLPAVADINFRDSGDIRFHSSDIEMLENNIENVSNVEANYLGLRPDKGTDILSVMEYADNNYEDSDGTLSGVAPLVSMFGDEIRDSTSTPYGVEPIVNAFYICQAKCPFDYESKGSVSNIPIIYFDKNGEASISAENLYGPVNGSRPISIESEVNLNGNQISNTGNVSGVNITRLKIRVDNLETLVREIDSGSNVDDCDLDRRNCGR